MLFDSAEAVLSVFGFSRSLYKFDKKKAYHWWDEIYQQRERDIETAKTELWNESVPISLFPDEDVLTREIETWWGFVDKLPTDDEVVLIKLFDSYYKNSVAINSQPQTHPYPSESLIMTLLLTQQTHQSCEITDTI
jgi:hypothetical protein